MRKPFYWKSRNAWYVKTDNSQVRLHEDEERAFEIWEQMRADSKSPLAPVNSFAHRYLTHCERRVENGTLVEATYKQYGRLVTLFCNFHGKLRADSIKRHHLTTVLEKNPMPDPKSRYFISAIKAFFQWCVDEDLIQKNPFSRYPRPKVKRREHLIDSDDHQKMMQSENLRTNEFRQILIALKHCGGRSGILCSVNIEDTNIGENPTWVIHQHKTKEKIGKSQIVYLSPCLATLTSIVRRDRKIGPLFTNSKQERWTSNAIGRRFRRIRERLGLSGKTCAYAYRHSFITTAMINGVDIATVAELIGHTDTKMINQHYGHLAKKSDHLSKSARKAV